LAVGLRPNPLGELKRFPRPPAAIRGLLLRAGEGKEGRGREGKGKRKGKGGPCSKVLGV